MPVGSENGSCTVLVSFGRSRPSPPMSTRSRKPALSLSPGQKNPFNATSAFESWASVSSWVSRHVEGTNGGSNWRKMLMGLVSACPLVRVGGESFQRSRMGAGERGSCRARAHSRQALAADETAIRGLNARHGHC